MTAQEKITEIVNGINVDYGDDTAYNMIWNAALQEALDRCSMLGYRQAIQDFEIENLMIEV